MTLGIVSKINDKFNSSFQINEDEDGLRIKWMLLVFNSKLIRLYNKDLKMVIYIHSLQVKRSVIEYNNEYNILRILFILLG